VTWVSPLALPGKIGRLEPLSHAHCDDLVEAVHDGELWNLWYTSVPSPMDMQDAIEKRLALLTEGATSPFAVIDYASGKAVGMTSYLNIDSANRRLEIGATWYARRLQGTGLNAECKLLLLSHAFEALACIAVEFRTHFFNHQSRRAIERLGAKLDGILRSHQLAPNGTLRDTCVYSIIASEWPTVKTHLEWRLARQARSAPGGR
jgi:RimJ/RimL family protein N-acetyltransferase